VATNSPSYSNLIFSGAGTKHLKTGVEISGDWTVGSSVDILTHNPTFTVTLGNVSGSGTITMGSHDLTVGGNWTKSGSTTGSGAVVLNGTSPSINTTTFNNLTLNNVTGATLTGAVTVNGTLTLTAGKLSTDATNILRLGASSSVVGGGTDIFVNGPVVNIWSSARNAVFPVGKGSTYRPLEINLTSPSVSPEIRAEVFNGSSGGDKGTLNAISVNRYYKTELLTGTPGSGTVKINFGADDGVTSNGTLVVARSGSQSGTYTDLSRTSSTTAYVISGTYTPAATDFLLLGSTATNPLPVQLKSFSAATNRLSSELHWSTATETNNYGFEIERKAVSSQLSAISWQKVGFVAGAGTSTSPKEYSYVDASVSPGRYAYRLKQVDNGGTFSYSGSAEVEIGLAAKEFKLESNYPNPFNPSTTIAFTLADDGKATLKVFNMLGQEVATLFDGEAQAGRIQQVKFDASRLPSGLYFAKLESGKQQMLRKMVLMK